MTLSCSRKATIRSCASPSSSIFSPAWRSGAASIDLICWRAPFQPTSSSDKPRAAALALSTGLFLAAMIPLKDGERGSTTPAGAVDPGGGGGAAGGEAGPGGPRGLDLLVAGVDWL